MWAPMCNLYEHEPSDGEIRHLFERRGLTGKNWGEAANIWQTHLAEIGRSKAGYCEALPGR